MTEIMWEFMKASQCIPYYCKRGILSTQLQLIKKDQEYFGEFNCIALTPGNNHVTVVAY